jgi:hypothetical protein
MSGGEADFIAPDRCHVHSGFPVVMSYRTSELNPFRSGTSYGENTASTPATSARVGP